MNELQSKNIYEMLEAPLISIANQKIKSLSYFSFTRTIFANASSDRKFWQDTCRKCIQNAKSLYHDFILNNQS